MIRKIAIAALVLAGCAQHKPSAPVAASPAPRQYPVIVSLVSRRNVIVVTAGPKAPLYSAKSKTGEVLVA